MKKLVLGFILGVLVWPSMAQASPITFAGSNTGSGGHLSASVTFDMVGSVLQITLTNTSAANVTVAGDVLTGVFFKLGSSQTLTPSAALLTSGSTVVFGSSQPLGGNVGGEWAYASALAAPRGADRGLSAVADGTWFGNGNLRGPNLSGTVAVGGLDYGITSASDTSGTDTGSVPLIQNSVTFQLTPQTAFDPSTGVFNVSFQYGPDMTGTNLAGSSGGGGAVPEPGTVVLVGTGLAFAARRRLQSFFA